MDQRVLELASQYNSEERIRVRVLLHPKCFGRRLPLKIYDHYERHPGIYEPTDLDISACCCNLLSG
uniref:C2H2-type domain-containing protein n=1 Tax=Brugia timori TaxID=42155 RepID=A0A0R3QBL5_9BILA